MKCKVKKHLVRTFARLEPSWDPRVHPHFSEVIKGSSQLAVLRIPLDFQDKTAREALQYMYARCAFQAATPHHITDCNVAEQLSLFAHKYNRC